jgi:hypothetical protein
MPMAIVDSTPEPLRRILGRPLGYVRRPLGRISQRTVRYADLGALQDTFLVSSVLMILIIRLQLFLTHYPQLGGGKLHIAHLLWGGLLMLIALVMLVSFIGRSTLFAGAVLGGLGFGFFIDELGKFVTSDNDYFFAPAAAMIYLVFIGLYFATRALQRRRGFSEREYLVNAVATLVEAARQDLDEDRRQRAIELLDRADPDDPMTAGVRELLLTVEARPARKPTRAARLGTAIRDRYFAILDHPRFGRFLVAVFIVWALVSVIQLTAAALSFEIWIGDGFRVFVGEANDVSFVNLASLISSLVSATLVAIGVRRVAQGARLAAYRWFDRALLVAIFVGQFFAFIEWQFGAVFGLSLDILLLVTVRYMIRRERDLERAAARQPRRPAPVGFGVLDSE